MILFLVDGRPTLVDIPGGWATIIVALISFVLAPYLVSLRQSKRLKKIAEQTGRTLEQVENNHRDPETGEPINLREEQDDRHEEIIGILRDHGELLEQHGN